MISRQSLEDVRALGEEWIAQLSRAVRGKPTFLRKFLTAWAAGGHVLLEDVPGVGKTTAVKALCRTIKPLRGQRMFQRIQFTPDLLPYDITGVEVFDPARKTFRFQQGPVFTVLLLADEINRAPPKVQSALLEAMEERAVTVGGVTYPLHPLFLVAATQNPSEMEGTFPLPLAQLDRFMLRLSLGYPEPAEESRLILAVSAQPAPAEDLDPRYSLKTVQTVQLLSRQVHVDERLGALIQTVLQRSRTDARVTLGLSPRAGIHWLRAARVWALWQGRDYVIDQDLLDLAVEALAHRLLLRDPDLVAASLIEEWIRDVLETFHRRGVP